MPTGLSAFAANGMLNAFRGVPFSVDEVWVRLFVGDPGAAFSANAATEATRKLCAFSAASGGVLTSSSIAQWVGIAGSQTATHFVAYDDPTAGNVLFSGVVTTPVTYVAGDTVTCAAGQFTATFPLAS